MDGKCFWQLGVIVDDLEGAMSELTEALGLDWTDIVDTEFDHTPLRVTMSRQGPPYFELIQAPAGSAWDARGGSTLDHVAYWSNEFDADRRRLESAGMPVVLDGQRVGRKMNYHALPKSGFRIEIFDGADRDGFRQRWGFDDVG